MTLAKIKKVIGARRLKALIEFAMEEFGMTEAEAKGMLRDCNREEFAAHLSACEDGYM